MSLPAIEKLEERIEQEAEERFNDFNALSTRLSVLERGLFNFDEEEKPKRRKNRQENKKIRLVAAE